MTQCSGFVWGFLGFFFCLFWIVFVFVLFGLVWDFLGLFCFLLAFLLLLFCLFVWGFFTVIYFSLYRFNLRASDRLPNLDVCLFSFFLF